MTINTGVQIFTLFSVKGEILFQQGTGGYKIWMRSAEKITVLDPDENPLFQVTDASDTTGGPDTSYHEDGLGNLFAVWQDDTSGSNKISMSKSKDAGAT
ncbi:MAG: hypothetical protein U0586_11905 [Candidatus Brocadiaceae bacterium]